MEPSTTTSDLASLGGRYLTVVLDQEAYGIAVLKVREIVRLQKITPIPQMPDYVKGVINLRGRVIPALDLRIRFGLKAELTDRTCVVIVLIDRPDRSVMSMGLIVDSVEEVAMLTAEEIEPTPDFGVRVAAAYLLGMAKSKGQVRMLIDIERVLGDLS